MWEFESLRVWEYHNNKDSVIWSVPDNLNSFIQTCSSAISVITLRSELGSEKGNSCLATSGAPKMDKSHFKTTSGFR